jgi:small subunit ribosomal protein S3Ae
MASLIYKYIIRALRLRMVQKAVPKASRKLKDKWRTKEWYSILAPDMFERVKIGETFTDDPQKLIGRNVEITAQDLTGDFTKMHIKLHFRIDDIREKEAYTSFLKQNLTSDYMRRLARRKRTRIEETFVVMTKDYVQLRIRPVAITEQRIQSSNQSSIRKVMHEELNKAASELLLADLLKNIISGQIARRIVQACKQINIINRVEIRKTERISKDEHEAGAEDAIPMVPPSEEGEPGTQVEETEPSPETVEAPEPEEPEEAPSENEKPEEG